MKCIISCLAIVCLFFISPAFALTPADCGHVGQIIEVHQIGSNMVDTPLACRENRMENWVSAPPEAGLDTQAICDKASKPYDENTGRDRTNMKNMSACFCLVNGNFAAGKETKCWTYFDLAE